MSLLNAEWRPGFGTIVTWFAIDKAGKIAVMVNNCYGELPRILLSTENVEALLDKMSEFMWDESSEFLSDTPNKQGELKVDLYSAWRYGHLQSKDSVVEHLEFDLAESASYAEANLSVNKGFFVYHGVEGDNEGADYPVGYSGKSGMGDYFRYLVPTKFANVNDIPEALHCVLVKSDSFDFANDQLLRNDEVERHFYQMFSSWTNEKRGQI
ncbi:hypothetical protein EJ576_20455 [Pseudomonas sp. C 49-2]|uniref:hypothetical protein n=1 Tax=Pseudomonas TaxID=286 RepID=UPI000F047FBC|nr:MULTISPECIES: hypothetical protein [Pseudomonas]MEB2647057.1 hypothetical protein [Pseudomonas canadensis]RTX96837.1 hypothetical protein EJ576_20455 [Pseudomonas sp. C 49-2]